MKIEFDPIRHEYFVAGKKVPSVTGIISDLQDFSAIPADILERSAQFGKHVHKACELYDDNNLDRDSLDPALDEYLSGWIKFLDCSGVQITLNEQKVFSKKYGYAGTLDRGGIFKNKLCLFDIKSGVQSKSAGPQTAAYNNAFHEMTGEKFFRRFTVLLRPNDFKLVEYKSRNDFNIFLSCLNIYNWKVANGKQ